MIIESDKGSQGIPTGALKPNEEGEVVLPSTLNIHPPEGESFAKRVAHNNQHLVSTVYVAGTLIMTVGKPDRDFSALIQADLEE